nr:MAG TPA: Receptor Binding Protein sandwich domain, phage receptor [Caudoviricetes sp.]
MSLTGITFANQKITPSDDGRLYGAMLADGILTGCGITFAAATLSVAAGSLLIGTRELRTSGETLSVTGATSGYARVIIDIDLTRAATKTSFEQAQFQIQYAASLDAFASLEQQDINTAGTHYQAVFCVLSLGTAGITGVVSSLASARVGVAQLTNDARFGTELAISTPGSTPDLAWGNALVWVWGTSMTIKLTAAVSALLPPNWQTRLFANDPFTFEWEGIGTPVNVAKGQTESAAGSIAVPAKKYIDLKKISDAIWIFSGTYASPMIYKGTAEPSADLGVDGDEYLMYSE